MSRGKGRYTYRQIITSPELIEQINPENKKLMERYLKNFSTKRSPKSVICYRSNLNIFFVWNVLHNENISFIDIKKLDLMDFFDFGITELKWSPNRYAQVHSCLSSFSAFIETYYDDIYPTFRNLLPKIEKPVKEAVRKKSVFTIDDINKLFNWLGNKGKTQEQCLLALMVGSGARVSELVRFTTPMIDENHTEFDGLFLETTEEMRVKGRGVNGKMMNRYIIKDLFMPYYNSWLPLRNKIMEETGQNHDYIFIKRDGTPASVSTIRAWIASWDDALDQHLYPHSLRHFWTTYLLSLGLEKEFVQELQQWSTDSLVTLYNDATAKDRKWKNLDKLKDAMASMHEADIDRDTTES